MEDNDVEPAGEAAAGGHRQTGIVYALYLAGLILWPAAVAGGVTAYFCRFAGDWALNQRRFQIRTFWIGVLYGACGFAVLALAIRLHPWLLIIPFPADLGIVALALILMAPWLSPVCCLLFLLGLQVLSLFVALESPHRADALQGAEWWLQWCSLTLFTALPLWGLFWWTKRCVVGLRHQSRQEPHPNPGTWLW